MSLKTEDVSGINKALNSGLILLANLDSTSGFRNTILIDPREEPESDAHIYGFGKDATFEAAARDASESFFNGGSEVGSICIGCAVEHGCQSHADRFLTAGGSVRAYQLNGENRLTLRDFHERYLIRIPSGPDFAETAGYMERFLAKRRDIFEKAWYSLPQFMRRSYQNPENLFAQRLPNAG